MIVPAVLVHGDKRQHINGGLEQIEAVTPTIPVKTVLWYTSHSIAFVGGRRTGSPLICVTRYAVFIKANEHHVVVRCGFVNHLLVNESIQHILVNTSFAQQIGKYPPHIVVGGRQFELGRCLLRRRHNGKHTITPAQQIFHCFRVRFLVEFSYEVDGIAAHLLILMEPKVSPDSDLLRTVQPFQF